jgi:hypothetical protein
MKTILFSTDFSSNVAHVARYAGMVAKLIYANVVLLNVFTVPTIFEKQLPDDIENFIMENKRTAQSNLVEFTPEFLKNSGL